MKIDIYKSRKKPAFSFVVPTGTDPTKLEGEAAAAIAKLSPLERRSHGEDFDSFFKGDLHTHLRAQISAAGAGVYRTAYEFGELTGSYDVLGGFSSTQDVATRLAHAIPQVDQTAK